MTKTDRLFNKGFLLFTALQTINFIFFYMMFPVVPMYASAIGISVASIGLIAGAGSFGAFIARPFAGYSMDHLNKKLCIIASLIVCAASTAILPISADPIFLCVVRTVYGIGFAFSSISMTNCAIDYIPKEKVGEGVGYIGLGISVAAAIGPAIGLALSRSTGYNILFLVIGGLTMVCCLSILPIKVKKTEKNPNKEKLSIGFFINAKSFSYAVFVIPFAFASGFVSSFIALLAKERNIENIALFFTVYAIAMMILKPMSGKIMDRKGLTAILIPSFLCAAMGTSLIAVGTSLAVMLAASVLLAFGQGAGQPSLQAQCIKVVDSSKKGIAISTYYIGLDIGNMLGNITGSGIAAATGYAGAFWVCSALLVIAMVIFLILRIRWARNRKRNRI